MSDLDYDAHFTDDERAEIADWDAGYYSCACVGLCRSLPCLNERNDIFVTVERILQARLLDLAQRAEVAEAAVERVRALADEMARDNCECEDHWSRRLRAALDRKEDQ